MPEQHSDYIFATIGEEWGFIGTFTIILVYTLLIMRMINRANKHRNIFNKIFIYSVASIFFFQFSINVSMVVGIFPTVGIPLPLLAMVDRVWLLLFYYSQATLNLTLIRKKNGN